jgi:hypothetical protein
MTDSLTAARLRELFHYDAAKGRLVRRNTHGNAHPAGRAVGSHDGGGYLRTTVDGKRYRLHRLIWLHVHGEWPTGEVDHINGDGFDNRLENLRLTDRRTNMENQRHARADNRGGLLGATWHAHSSKWRARITLGGRQKHLGSFDTAEAAHAVYLAAKRQSHAGCTL